MQTILDACRGLAETTHSSGEVLIAEGARTGRLYILIEGRVEILKGDFQVHVAAEPGAIFGEISALLDIPHTATVRTLAPSRLYVAAPGGDFLRSHPEIAYLVSKMLAQRLYGVTTYLSDLKAQFEEHRDHFAMVDEVLVTLMHQQDEQFAPGSDRHPDPTL